MLTDTMLVARSGNSKTGPIPVTYRTTRTCPTACPFLPTNGGGCYASGRIFALADRGARDVTAEDARTTLAKREAGARYMRDRVSGDLVTAEGTFDWDYLVAIAKYARDAGLTVFGYTHAWRLLTKRDVARIRKTGYVLNASCETEADVRAATKLGLPTVLVGNEWTEGAMLGPRRVVTCLAQTRDTDCASCGLCASPDRAAVVRFEVHGPARGRARTTLAALAA